jgi:ATP phosphoribosyltransferase
VISGDVHLGVTGEDLLREAAPALDVVAHLLAPLGFGHARVVVAAPRSWIDVDTMADLDDVGERHERRTGQTLRVATKYVRLTRRFFGAAGVGHYRIVESAGATEGAPAAGAAELVVDITTTGATLESNGLKVLRDGLILDSQAQLAASLRADWSQAARASLKGLLAVLDARGEGRAMRTLRFDPAFDVSALQGDATKAFEPVGPGAIICDKAMAHDLARAIAEGGGGSVRTEESRFIFRGASPRFDSFVLRLGQG